MKNKKSLIVLLLVAIIGVVGLTFAYFTNSSTFNNIFFTKQYGTSYTEEFISPNGWLPGDTTEKTIIATNSGEVNEAVRIKVNEKWLSANNQELSLNKDGIKAAIINLDNSREWIKEDDYYYYKYAIGPQESTSSFIKSVTFNPDITLDNTCEETETSTGKTVTCSSSGNDYDDAVYTLTFNIETVQYDKYKQAWNTNVVIEPNKNNILYEYVAENGEIYTGNGSTEYTNNVYFLTESTNNNVMFANQCWKIVRTTDTGGVKLLYNGEQKEEANYEYDKLSDTELLNITNDETYPFNYDSSTKEWSSTNIVQGSTSTFTFSVPNSGEYLIDSNVSGRWDYVNIYKDEEYVGLYSSKKTIDLGTIDSSNIIKIVFIKFEYATPAETDKVIFSLGKVTNVERTKHCNNYNTTIGVSEFNLSNSPAYAGYMYNKVYTVYDKTSSTDYSIRTIGRDVTYNQDLYRLIDFVEYNSIYLFDNYHHYTCENDSGECNIVQYMFYKNPGGYGPPPSFSYLVLSDTNNIQSALDEMLNNNDVNSEDSLIKSKIDSWYETNMLDYTNYLEDTIFCNDRSIKSLGAWNPNGGNMGDSLIFNGSELSNDITCLRKNDSFTVNENIGNGALTYPIGLLSVPEANLWGKEARTNNETYLLGTPYEFKNRSSYTSWGVSLSMNVVNDQGEITSSTGYSLQVCPSVSLKPLTKYTSGDGTVNSPFLISTE